MDEFKAALDAARKRIEVLQRHRQQIDVEIAKTEQIEAALRVVVEPDEATVEMSGITDAVRSILKRSIRKELSPVEVRDQLNAAGYDFESRYSNLIASIHVVLKRLVKSNEAMEVATADGKKYWWALNGNPPSSPPARRSVHATGTPSSDTTLNDTLKAAGYNLAIPDAYQLLNNDALKSAIQARNITRMQDDVAASLKADVAASLKAIELARAFRGATLRVLQLREDSPDAPGHASDGSRHRGSRMVDRRNRGIVGVNSDE